MKMEGWNERVFEDPLPKNMPELNEHIRRSSDLIEVTESALDTQVSGSHYKDMKIQPIEYIEANQLTYIQGNLVKYATRYITKNGAEDLRKIIHYCQLEIEQRYDNK